MNKVNIVMFLLSQITIYNVNTYLFDRDHYNSLTIIPRMGQNQNFEVPSNNYPY